MRSNSEKAGYVLSTTILKAFKLLDYIGDNQPVDPSELVSKLGFSRANVYRLLSTFINIGYVEKSPRGYSLTFRLFKLGSTVPLTRNLRDVGKPVMLDLMKQAEENVYMNVLTKNMVVAIDEIKSSHHIILNPDITYTYPVHSCASGKVLLSLQAEDKQAQVIAGLEMEPCSRHTITDKDIFLATLKEAKERGYAMEIQEFSDELNSIAAPIFDYRKQAVATISISGPCMRLTVKRMESLVDALKDAAARISMQLGQTDETEVRMRR